MKRYTSHELESDSRICGGQNGAPLAIARAKTSIVHDFERPHIHPNSFEFYLFLSGTAQMEVSHELIEVRGGDIILVEANEPHTIKSFQTETDYITIRLANAEKTSV